MEEEIGVVEGRLKHEDVLIFVKWLDLNTSNSQDRAQAARDYG
jgi:hypothetical protein